MTTYRSSKRRFATLVLVLLLAVALPSLSSLPVLSAQAEPGPGPRFQQPGPRLDPERSDAAKAMKRLTAKNNAAQAKQAAQAKTAVKAKKGTKAKEKGNKNKKGSSAPGAQAAPAADYSSSTPQTMRDNIVGDFRGVGYQQRMRVENNQLTIRDPQQQGGRVTSVTTDLAPAPDTIDFNVSTLGGNQSFPLHTYSQWASDHARAGSGGFEFLFDVFHINTVYLAQMDGYVYILGTQGSNGYNPAVDTSPPASQYRVRLYKIAMSQAVNGCASATCAVATYDFPTAWNLDGSTGNILPYYPRAIGPSSLAAGHVAGRGYLAVGLTDGGVYILDTNLSKTDGYAGMAVADGSQTPVTALAWDPAGSGLLSVGVTSWWYTGFFATINASGKVTAEPGNIWPSAPWYSLIPTPMTTAVFDQGDGTKMVAFGQSDWSVQLVNPAFNPYSNTVANLGAGAPGIPVAINPIPRVNTPVSGGPDLAISHNNGSGSVIRWDPGTATMSRVPITANNGTSIAGDTAFDAWYPGLKQGRIKITNASQEEVTVSIESSPDAGKGCWYAPAWADAAAFPDKLTVGAGEASASYVVGYQSSGEEGNCFTADATGVKRAYLVIAPTNRPADQQIVELQIADDPLRLTLPSNDQAGSGSTTATLSAKVEQLAAVGLWNVTVDTSDLPTPTAAPQVKVVQLTPGASSKDNPAATSPVYKLTVQPLTWTVPGLDTSAASRLQAVIPPLTVQGSNDGTSWIPIGAFMPVGAVNFDPTKGTATTSGGTFYWENTTSTSYTSLRVVAGHGQNATTSTPTTLTPTTLTPTFTATSITLDPAQSSASFTPNGVDSYPLTVTVNTSGTSPSDPTQNVYYRLSETSALITSLYLTDQQGNQVPFLGVQPAAGAYPNTVGSRRAAAGQSTDYVVTTNPNRTDVAAVIWTGRPDLYARSSAEQINPTLMSLEASQTTPPGFTLQSCAVGGPGGCGVSEIAPMGTTVSGSSRRAALYQAGQLATATSAAGPPLLGVLFEPLAINDAANSLPLTWTAGNTPELATSQVTVSYSTDSVTVASRGSFPSGDNTIVVPAVSRGLLIMASVDN